MITNDSGDVWFPPETFNVELPLQVVNIPWLQNTEATERRLWPGSPSSPGSPGSPSAEKSNESRFSVNLREVLDISRSSFAVSKGDWLELLKFIEWMLLNCFRSPNGLLCVNYILQFYHILPQRWVDSTWSLHISPLPKRGMRSSDWPIFFFGRLKHQSGDGTDTLFKASVVAGGILALTEVDVKDPDILLRAGSGQKRMLTIMEGNGSYFGKIEIADSRGMVLYHMQKPCATITADVKDLSMQVYPLSADAKFLRAASMIKKGERLRIQVSKNFDASLLLGCLLGIVILEPDLMERACHH